MRSRLHAYAITVLAVVAATTANMAAAATVVHCPMSLTAPENAYLRLAIDAGSADCVTYGSAKPRGGLDRWVEDHYDTTLYAKSDGFDAGAFSYLAGSGTGGLHGAFRVQTDSLQYLLFKTGGGINTPSWFLFRVSGIDNSTIFHWNILGNSGRLNSLSHVAAFVPIPAAAWLMGSGLVVLFGVAQRRRRA